MRKKLQERDQVRYQAGRYRMRATVIDALPLRGEKYKGQPVELVPVLVRKRVRWIPRAQLRKLP